MSELKDIVFDIVTNPPCRECEFWDVQVCILKVLHPDIEDKCALVRKLLDVTDRCDDCNLYQMTFGTKSVEEIHREENAEFDRLYREAYPEVEL